MALIRYPARGEPVSNFDAHGVRSTLLASGRGNGHVWQLVFEANGVIDTHVAGFDQLFYVLEGSAWVTVCDETITVHSGEGATIRTGQPHAKGSLTGASVLMVQLSQLEVPAQ